MGPQKPQAPLFTKNRKVKLGVELIKLFESAGSYMGQELILRWFYFCLCPF